MPIVPLRMAQKVSSFFPWDGATDLRHTPIIIKKRYVLVVNSSAGPVGFVLKGFKKGTYKDLFTNEKHIVKDGSLSLSVVARRNDFAKLNLCKFEEKLEICLPKPFGSALPNGLPESRL